MSEPAAERAWDVSTEAGLLACYDVDGIVAITWQPEPGVTALFGWRGPLDEALAIADSFYGLGRAEWEALVPPYTSPADGCRGLFC